MPPHLLIPGRRHPPAAGWEVVDVSRSPEPGLLHCCDYEREGWVARASRVRELTWWLTPIPWGLLGALLEVPGPAWSAEHRVWAARDGGCQKQFLGGSDKCLMPTSFPQGGASGGGNGELASGACRVGRSCSGESDEGSVVGTGKPCSQAGPCQLT